MNRRPGASSILWWRIAFAVYAVALITATHWPRVELGEPGLPSPDKMLHLYSFALLTALLWMTRIFRSVTVLSAVALLWVAADELTQALPGLERQISVEDFLAGAGGVLTMSALIASLRPIGGEAARMQRALYARVFESVFSSPLAGIRPALAWALLVLAVVPIGASLVWFWPRAVAALPYPVPAMLYGAGQALWLGVLLHIFGKLWSARMRSARDQRWCPTCGAPAAGGTEPADFDEHGRTSCPRCNEPIHRGVWLERVSSDTEIVRRRVWKPLAFGGLFLVIEFGAIYGFVALHQSMVRGGVRITWIHRIARTVNELPRDFTMTIDFALLLLAVAVVIRLYRRASVRAFDRQGEVCRKCGHDLRFTPVLRGIGICGECGTAFARFADQRQTRREP